MIEQSNPVMTDPDIRAYRTISKRLIRIVEWPLNYLIAGFKLVSGEKLKI